MPNKYQKLLAQLGDIRAVSATPEQLDDIEARLGYSLPDDYREFLLDYSGCSFCGKLIVFPFLQDNYETLGSISMFYEASSVESDIATRHRLSLENQELEEIDYYLGVSLFRPIEGIEEIGWPEELVPIGCDYGGNQICLALFGLRPGSIFYWMNCPSRGGHNPYLIANSFDEFIHLLKVGE